MDRCRTCDAREQELHDALQRCADLAAQLARLTEAPTLGGRIRSARRAAGLSQVELARLCDVSVHDNGTGRLRSHTVSRWENDRSPPRDLSKVAAALGVSETWLRLGGGQAASSAKLEADRRIWEAGYRSGYSNGKHDQAEGETVFGNNPADGFELWLADIEDGVDAIENGGPDCDGIDDG